MLMRIAPHKNSVGFDSGSLSRNNKSKHMEFEQAFRFLVS